MGGVVVMVYVVDLEFGFVDGGGEGYGGIVNKECYDNVWVMILFDFVFVDVVVSCL